MVIAIVPPVVTLVMRRVAAGVRGTVAYDRQTSIDVRAGPVHFTEVNDAELTMLSGTDRRVKFLRIVQNGKAQSEDQLSKMGEEITSNLEHGKGFFKEPYLARYAPDYTYDVNHACACPPGQVDVHFTSAIHDDQHGVGDMYIDSASGRLRTVTYMPFVFPPHADAGTITETFGEAIPGLWTVVRIDRLYTGHVWFVTGRGVVSEVLYNFRRVAGSHYAFNAASSFAPSGVPRPVHASQPVPAL